MNEHGDAPRILHVFGRVAALGVEADREWAALRIGEELVTVDATAEQAEQAITLRHEAIQAVYLVRPGTTRPALLRIDDAERQLGGTPEQRTEAISTRWENVLAELARRSERADHGAPTRTWEDVRARIEARLRKSRGTRMPEYSLPHGRSAAFPSSPNLQNEGSSATTAPISVDASSAVAKAKRCRYSVGMSSEENSADASDLPASLVEVRSWGLVETFRAIGRESDHPALYPSDIGWWAKLEGFDFAVGVVLARVEKERSFEVMHGLLEEAYLLVYRELEPLHLEGDKGGEIYVTCDAEEKGRTFVRGIGQFLGGEALFLPLLRYLEERAKDPTGEPNEAAAGWAEEVRRLGAEARRRCESEWGQKP